MRSDCQLSGHRVAGTTTTSKGIRPVSRGPTEAHRLIRQLTANQKERIGPQFIVASIDQTPDHVCGKRPPSCMAPRCRREAWSVGHCASVAISGEGRVAQIQDEVLANGTPCCLAA